VVVYLTGLPRNYLLLANILLSSILHRWQLKNIHLAACIGDRLESLRGEMSRTRPVGSQRKLWARNGPYDRKTKREECDKYVQTSEYGFPTNCQHSHKVQGRVITLMVELLWRGITSI
jgi:hypothetical protein